MNIGHRIAIVGLTFIALLGGCRKHDDKTAEGSGTKVTLMLNWKPDAEFGGFYDAQQSGVFTAHKLNVNLTEIPDAVAGYNIVNNGQADFAIAAADEVLMARNHNIDVVAIFAVFQTSPQGIMVHQSRKMQSISDVFTQPGKLYAEPNADWLTFCQRKFQPQNVKTFALPKGGALGVFLADPGTSQQCFVTSEPIEAGFRKSDPQTFLIADAGFNPYTTVVITRGSMVREHPVRVAAMIAACREGWIHYLSDPKPANEKMAAQNTDESPATFAAAAAEQKPLIETDGGKPVTVGSMTEQRWNDLSLQMANLGLIGSAMNGRDCFVPEPAAK